MFTDGTNDGKGMFLLTISGHNLSCLPNSLYAAGFEPDPIRQTG